ncbi:hypothetical protein OS493_007567 [Desmophyllum pertusum]|uniref:SRCR domain-containing protein n=1 Tax=Desmophyllum pertusum TaxID=174260 RepID=A0A9W9Z3E1_9CNID|nr:hypothetical protein OS493_007567 [Desmophyllum pertusum]
MTFWHAVCSIGWEKHDADVVCRQLGFPEAVVELGHGQFGSGPGPMWLTSVGCQGNETSLDQCVSAGWELETDCGNRYGAGVICKMDNITGDGEVRLRGSNELHEGRVELGYRHAVRVYSHSRYGDVDLKTWLSSVHCTGGEKNILYCPRDLNYDLYAYRIFTAGVECTNNTNYTSGHVQVKYNGTWGTICAPRQHDLTYRSAEVICRQLHQGPPVKHSFMNRECSATNHGAETVWLSDLNCQGFEDSIDQCPHRGWSRLDPLYCGDIALRLIGSNLSYAGRVEVHYAGVWGLICPRHMNGTVFKVICRQLGFADVMGDVSLYGTLKYPRRQFRLYGKGNGPVWLSKVYCHGNESNLSQCEIDSPGEILWCNHEEALELMCRPKHYTLPYPVRLAGTSVTHAGLVEVFYNGTWVRYVVARANGMYQLQTLWSCVDSLDSVQLSVHPLAG